MLRFNWIAELTQAERLICFVYEYGSVPHWFRHHEHRLRPAEGGVEMKELVHYALPIGLLGRMVHAAIVSKQLKTTC